MDLDSAIQNHKIWDILFRNAIRNKGALDEAMIAQDHCCPLGQWLHGKGKAEYGKLRSFKNCVLNHASFHVEATKLFQAINEENYAAAEEMLGKDSKYSIASNKVVGAIMELKNEANL